MTGNANEISPQSWEYRLVASIVYAVEQRAGGAAGGPRSRWNGRLIEESDPRFLGGATLDGTMSVSVARVLDPLRRARDLDRPLTDDEAYALRDAMATLTHEAAHLLVRFGDPTAPEAYPYDAAWEAYNEGRIEHWTHRNLDKVIGDVFTDAGLDKAEAAVLSQSSVDAYPGFTPAVRHLDQALAQRSGLTSDQVTEKLMRADHSQRWNVAADLLIYPRLVEPGLMPEGHRAQVRRRLVAPLRDSLSGLQAGKAVGALWSKVKAISAARRAVAGLDKELDRIERQYRIHNAQRAQRQSRDPASRLRQAVRQALQKLPPDLIRLQAMMSDQAPAAGATSQSAGGTDHALSEPDNRSRGQHAPRRQPGPHTPGLG